LCWQGQENFDSTTAPDVAHLTALQKLDLECSFDRVQLCPSLLLHMQQLRHLQLWQFVVPMPALLAALRGMQQLQHLSLSLANGTQALEGADMKQYSAFTASPQLTHLHIDAVTHRSATFVSPMPLGAVQHIFPEGKQLPHLKQLHFNVAEDDWEQQSQYLELFGPDDLAVVAAACPALEQLWALGALQRDAQLAQLATMTSVTQLKIGGRYTDTAELVAAVAEMTQLQDLAAVVKPGLWPMDLGLLTQLMELRRLRLLACDVARPLGEGTALRGIGDLQLTSKVRKSCCASRFSCERQMSEFFACS
jgi:hypothetical protein